MYWLHLIFVLFVIVYVGLAFNFVSEVYTDYTDPILYKVPEPQSQFYQPTDNSAPQKLDTFPQDFHEGSLYHVPLDNWQPLPDTTV